MNAKLLSQEVRNKAASVLSQKTTQEERQDVAELLHVLARILDGAPISRAFGSPGDWGYETPIGQALHSA